MGEEGNGNKGAKEVGELREEEEGSVGFRA